MMLCWKLHVISTFSSFRNGTNKAWVVPRWSSSGVIFWIFRSVSVSLMRSQSLGRVILFIKLLREIWQHSIAFLLSVIGVVLDNDNSMKIFFVKFLTISYVMISRPDMIKSSMSVMVFPRYMLLVTMISVVNGWTA